MSTRVPPLYLLRYPPGLPVSLVQRCPLHLSFAALSPLPPSAFPSFPHKLGSPVGHARYGPQPGSAATYVAVSSPLFSHAPL
eukprot:3337474-Rhodomonas_salina.1